MNLYQLAPTTCYDHGHDDEEAGDSEFWACGTTDGEGNEDGRTSRSGFYGDPVDNNPTEGMEWVDSSSSEGLGWYSSVVSPESRCTAAAAAPVPPVPRLLPLDAGLLRFFDDDDSSTENETVFGRTLDTISEEDDEDDVTERVAATGGLVDNECSLHVDRRSADLSKFALFFSSL